MLLGGASFGNQESFSARIRGVLCNGMIRLKAAAACLYLHIFSKQHTAMQKRNCVLLCHYSDILKPFHINTSAGGRRTQCDVFSRCFFAVNSRMEAHRRSPPKSFRSKPVSQELLRTVKKAAATHPATTAGMTCRKESFFCMIRMTVAISAGGRKNNKFIYLAVGYSILQTSVSQMISKLPPPTPRPDKIPSTKLSKSVKRKDI